MQGTLEKAIREVTGEPVTLTASGRTDAGAHAHHQVVAFPSGSPLSTEALQKALNANLPDDVAIYQVRDADEDFHPRFDAVSRTYRYLIWNRPTRSPFWHGRATHIKQPLDSAPMHVGAQLLVGAHDMSSFIPAIYDGDPVRDIYRASVTREGDLITIEIEASGFLRQMVRAIAGTLIKIGLGALAPQEFGRILESRRRDAAADTAPAEGLYLFDVRYDRDLQAGHSTPDQLARDVLVAGSSRENA